MVRRAARVGRYVPERGDAIWLEFDPRAGHEQAGRRPALVVSPMAYNAKVGLALVCPITSQVKGYPFEVAVPSGLKITGVILSDQIKSIDWRSRKAKRISAMPVVVVETVIQRIEVLLRG
ncbi:MAG: endoribonuclease MazF [Gemmatimonadaceae bacterium]